jgi:hypothetical protein
MGRLAPQFGHALERVLDLNLCRSAIQELRSPASAHPGQNRVIRMVEPNPAKSV